MPIQQECALARQTKAWYKVHKRITRVSNLTVHMAIGSEKRPKVNAKGAESRGSALFATELLQRYEASLPEVARSLLPAGLS